MLVGFPFLPSNKQQLLTWLVENLAKAAYIGINIDICVVIYAEGWPCSWKNLKQFWGSDMLTDPNLKPCVYNQIHLNPMARCYLKAGCGGHRHP